MNVQPSVAAVSQQKKSPPGTQVIRILQQKRQQIPNISQQIKPAALIVPQIRQQKRQQLAVQAEDVISWYQIGVKFIDLGYWKEGLAFLTATKEYISLLPAAEQAALSALFSDLQTRERKSDQEFVRLLTAAYKIAVKRNDTNLARNYLNQIKNIATKYNQAALTQKVANLQKYMPASITNVAAPPM